MMVLEVAKVKASELYSRDVIRERQMHDTSGVPGVAVLGVWAGTCRRCTHYVLEDRLSVLGDVGSWCSGDRDGVRRCREGAGAVRQRKLGCLAPSGVEMPHPAICQAAFFRLQGVQSLTQGHPKSARPQSLSASDLSVEPVPEEQSGGHC